MFIIGVPAGLDDPLGVIVSPLASNTVLANCSAPRTRINKHIHMLDVYLTRHWDTCDSARNIAGGGRDRLGALHGPRPPPPGGAQSACAGGIAPRPRAHSFMLRACAGGMLERLIAAA